MSLQHIEFLLEASILVARTSKSYFRVVDATIVQCTFLVFIGYGIVSSQQSCLIDGPVIVTIFQSSRSSCRTDFERYITTLHIFAQTIEISHLRSSDHRFQRFFLINIRTLSDSISQYRSSMITAHTPIVVSHVAPDRKQTMHTLLLMANHRHYHIAGFGRFHQHQERMLGTIGIPQRKYGVVGKIIGLMNILVKATILAIHIHIDRRID